MNILHLCLCEHVQLSWHPVVGAPVARIPFRWCPVHGEPYPQQPEQLRAHAASIRARLADRGLHQTP